MRQRNEPEKVKVGAYERTGPDGSKITVSGYERLKGDSSRHRGTLDTMKEGGVSDKIVQRDPTGFGAPTRPKVKVVGGVQGGVKRVSR